MTTPAADCGVPAGCGACPLGRAGVCGDPETPTSSADPFDWGPIVDAYLASALAEARAASNDAPDLDPAEPRPADAGCCGGGCGG